MEVDALTPPLDCLMFDEIDSIGVAPEETKGTATYGCLSLTLQIVFVSDYMLRDEFPAMSS